MDYPLALHKRAQNRAYCERPDVRSIPGPHAPAARLSVDRVGLNRPLPIYKGSHLLAPTVDHSHYD